MNYSINDYALKIAENFSRQAVLYDQLATVQLAAAQHLANKLPKSLPNPLGKILEIGCGTGNLSRELVNRFPESEIHFLDAAPQMLEICKDNIEKTLPINTNKNRFKFINETLGQYLKEKPVPLPHYSLIVSSFTLHWLIDFLPTMQDLVAKLDQDGQFFFSFPSNKSFPEWKSVCCSLNLPYTGNQLPDHEYLSQFAQKDYLSFNFEEYSHTASFESAFQFFKQMKQLGANTRFSSSIKSNARAENLNVKEMRALIASWNNLNNKNADYELNNAKPEKIKQTVHCTYWFIEGIITRHKRSFCGV